MLSCMRTVVVMVHLPSNRALTKAGAHAHTHILIIKTHKEYKAQSGLVLPARHCQGPHMHSLLSYFLRSSSLGTRSLKFLPLFFLTKGKNFKLNSAGLDSSQIRAVCSPAFYQLSVHGQKKVHLSLSSEKWTSQRAWHEGKSCCPKEQE